MNYNECLEIALGNKNLEGKYLDIDFSLTDKEHNPEYIVEKVTIVPLDDAEHGIFRIRLNQRFDFDSAIEPHKNSDKLTVNLFVKNLKSDKYAFINYNFSGSL